MRAGGKVDCVCNAAWYGWLGLWYSRPNSKFKSDKDSPDSNCKKKLVTMKMYDCNYASDMAVANFSMNLGSRMLENISNVRCI